MGHRCGLGSLRVPSSVRDFQGVTVASVPIVDCHHASATVPGLTTKNQPAPRRPSARRLFQPRPYASACHASLFRVEDGACGALSATVPNDAPHCPLTALAALSFPMQQV